MDGFEATEGIVMMAATNRPDILDPALLRPGRFDRQVVVPLPELDERLAILEVHCKDKRIAPDVDLDVVARGTPGMSGADLSNLVNEAALFAVRRGAEPRSTCDDFEQARDRVLMGQRRESMVLSEQREGAHRLPRGRPRRLRRGAPPRRPDPQGHDPPVGHGPRRHPAAARRGAPQLRPGLPRGVDRRWPWAAASPRSSCSAWSPPAPTTTSSVATERARKMVREWGMSERIGPMAWGSQGQVFLGEDLMHTRDYSDDTARVIDEEVERILREQEDRCRAAAHREPQGPRPRRPGAARARDDRRRRGHPPHRAGPIRRPRHRGRAGRSGSRVPLVVVLGSRQPRRPLRRLTEIGRRSADGRRSASLGSALADRGVRAMADVDAAGVVPAQIRARRRASLPRLAAVSLVVALSLAAASCRWTDQASIELPGSPIGTPRTDQPDLSADGRFVAYQSDSPSLVPDDTNGASDVFVRDERTGTTERVSVSSSGGQADASSFDPHLSADGRFVVFSSVASNLVGGDTDQSSDVFVHDRSTGGTRRVSDASPAIAESPDISGDGRWIVYQSGRLDPRLLQFPFVLRYDTSTGSSNTVAGGLGAGPTVGATDASISDDGRYVTYTAYRAGGGPTGFLVPLATVRDLAPSGATVTVADPGRDATISGDGRSIAYVDDHLDGTPIQVLVVDRVTSTRDLVSATGSGQPSTGSSGQPSISGDGRFVVFTSTADDLVDQDTGAVQVYLRDRESRRTSVVSRDGLGVPADAPASAPSVAADGGYATFTSTATNLSAGDLDGDADVFVTTTLEPDVTLAQPATLAPGTTTTIVITGGAFRGPLTVGVSGARDVTFGPATVVSPTRVEVAATVAATAPPGPRILVVVELGTGPGPTAFAAGACQCLAVSP